MSFLAIISNSLVFYFPSLNTLMFCKKRKKKVSVRQYHIWLNSCWIRKKISDTSPGVTLVLGCSMSRKYHEEKVKRALKNVSQNGFIISSSYQEDVCWGAQLGSKKLFNTMKKWQGKTSRLTAEHCFQLERHVSELERRPCCCLDDESDCIFISDILALFLCSKRK